MWTNEPYCKVLPIFYHYFFIIIWQTKNQWGRKKKRKKGWWKKRITKQPNKKDYILTSKNVYCSITAKSDGNENGKVKHTHTHKHFCVATFGNDWLLRWLTPKSLYGISSSSHKLLSTVLSTLSPLHKHSDPPPTAHTLSAGEINTRHVIAGAWTNYLTWEHRTADCISYFNIYKTTT